MSQETKERQELINQAEVVLRNKVIKGTLNRRKILQTLEGKGEMTDSECVRSAVNDHNWGVVDLAPNAQEEFLYHVEDLPNGRIRVKRRC